MLIKPIKTRIFLENENIIDFIVEHVPSIKEKSVLAITSKIVSLNEGRTDTDVSKENKIRLIKKESELAFETQQVWLTVRQNLIMPNAGIDESNANGKLILLPKDSFKRATTIQKALKKKYRIKNLGVLITDSRLLPMRNGTVGVALGYAGFKGKKDYRGKKDLFGRKFKLSQTDVADSLASSAVLLMGEGDESTPLALMENAPVLFVKKVDRKELTIDIKKDVYQPLFEKIHKLKWKTKKRG